MKLCALSDVKTLLDISDTTQDAKIGLMIDRVSSLAVQYLGYNPKRTTYTSEKYAVTNIQYLQLNNQPIQSIASVTLQGTAVTDYGTESNDYAVGLLYRGSGWVGRCYTRGMTYDIVSGFRDVEITYTAGWYLPGDAGYVADDPASLPMAIQSAMIQATIEMYRVNIAAAEGLLSHSEGGISDTWSKGKMAVAQGSTMQGALSEEVRSALQPYVRIAIA